MAFNPDEYLQSKEFNPDSYLADKSAADQAKQPGFLQRLASNVIDDAPKIAGAVAGGAIMAPVAAAVLPFTGPTGAMAVDATGQGLGYMAGGALQQVYQQVTGSENAPKTSGEAAGQLGKDFATGFGGAVIAKPLNAVLGPVANKISAALKPAAIEGAQAIKDAFSAFGGQFLPSQVTKSGAIDFLENFIGSTFTGSGPIRIAHEANEKALRSMAGSIADKLVSTVNQPGLEEGGKLIVQAVTDGESAFQAAAKPLYDKVDELTKDAVVSSLPLKAQVQEIVAENTSKFVNPAGATTLSPAVKNIVGIVQNLKDNLSFGEMQTLRSQLGQQAKDLVSGASKDSAAVRLYSSLAKITSDQMDNSASALSPEALSAWKTATNFYRTGKEVFTNDLINKVVDKDPALVGRSLFQANSISSLRAVKTALAKGAELTGDSTQDVYKNLLSGHWDEFMTKMTNPATGDLNGSAMLKHISDPKTADMFKEAYGELFPKIQEFTKIASMVSEKAAGKGGGIAGALSQVGAGRDIIAAINPIIDSQKRGRLIANGVALMFAPMGLSKMMTTPEGLQLITSGFKSSLEKGAKNASVALGQLVTHALQQGYLDKGNDNGQE